MKSVCGLLLMGCVFLCGCSSAPKLYVVTGTVTVNGKPAEGAIINFHPDDNSVDTASAVADSTGAFKPISQSLPGMRAGHYKVTVIWPDPSKKPTESQKMMGTMDVGPDLLKGKYSLKSSTTLSADITDRTTSLPPFAL